VVGDDVLRAVRQHEAHAVALGDAQTGEHRRAPLDLAQEEPVRHPPAEPRHRRAAGEPAGRGVEQREERDLGIRLERPGDLGRVVLEPRAMLGHPSIIPKRRPGLNPMGAMPGRLHARMADWVEQVREAARAALPPVGGELRVPGLSAPVEVIRDRWGVPHIYARSTDDLFVAQGYVVASERLFQIDSALRLAGGRLATMFADLVLPMDRFARTVGWNRAGARIAAAYDERSRRMMEAFRAGVRAWLETMPAPPVEYSVPGLEPEVPEDDGAWAAAAVFVGWGLSANWDNELLRVGIAERLGWEAVLDLFPDL